MPLTFKWNREWQRNPEKRRRWVAALRQQLEKEARMNEQRKRKTDVVKFEGGVIVGEHLEDWTGEEWPPPERLGIAVSTLTGMVVVVDPAHTALLEEMQEASTIDLRWYRRSKASGLPPQYEGDMFIRGAEYVVEEET